MQSRLSQRLTRGVRVLLTLLLLLFTAGCGGFLLGRARLADLPPRRAGTATEVTLHAEGAPVRIFAIPTGTVSIKGCHHAACLPEWLPYPLRFAAILADPSLGERLPIWSYVIVHPEGVFAIDAGASPSYNDDASWDTDPVSGFLIRSFIRLDITPDETLAARLAALGIPPDTVQALILTHQHVDHTAGAPDFPAADLWTTRAEEDAASKIGAVPWRWQGPDTRLRYVDDEGHRPEDLPWTTVHLTRDGSLRAMHTPGHTPGSVTVSLTTDEGELWFIGDTSFRADQLDPEAATAGIHTDLPSTRALQRWLAARPQPRIFLPAHDDAVPEHLAAARAWRAP